MLQWAIKIQQMWQTFRRVFRNFLFRGDVVLHFKFGQRDFKSFQNSWWNFAASNCAVQNIGCLGFAKQKGTEIFIPWWLLLLDSDNLLFSSTLHPIFREKIYHICTFFTNFCLQPYTLVITLIDLSFSICA